MSEPSKRKAPIQQGVYGQGFKSNTRSTINPRNAKTPAQGRAVVASNQQKNNPANSRRK